MKNSFSAGEIADLHADLAGMDNCLKTLSNMAGGSWRFADPGPSEGARSMEHGSESRLMVI